MIHRDPDELHLHAEPVGKGTTAIVTVRRGGPEGEVVTSERLDLARGKQRRELVEDLRKRLGEDAHHLIDAEAVEQQLAEAAAGLAASPMLVDVLPPSHATSKTPPNVDAPP